MIPEQGAERLKSRLNLFGYKFHDLGDSIVVSLPLSCSIQVSEGNGAIDISPQAGFFMSRKQMTWLNRLVVFAIAVAAGLEWVPTPLLFMFLFIGIGAGFIEVFQYVLTEHMVTRIQNWLEIETVS